MKKAIGMILGMAMGAQGALAGERVVSARNVVIYTEINSQSLKFSRADYSSPVVKILVPGLADETLLNHRNSREGAPCLAAYDAPNPESVIGNRTGVEKVIYNIQLKKNFTLDSNNICHLTLTENIKATIRGYVFEHGRTIALPDRVAEDCR